MILGITHPELSPRFICSRGLHGIIAHHSVSLHTLRHSHGSHLLAAGMEITAVSERLGHSSVRVTADVYSHAIRGRDDEAARRWEEFQGRNLPEKHTGVQ